MNKEVKEFDKAFRSGTLEPVNLVNLLETAKIEIPEGWNNAAQIKNIVFTIGEPTYTEEEIKKMWEDAGYEWKEIEYKEGLKGIVISKKCKKPFEYCIRIYIRLSDKTYSVTQFISSKEHQLLTKTFRALGWKNV